MNNNIAYGIVAALIVVAGGIYFLAGSMQTRPAGSDTATTTGDVTDASPQATQIQIALLDTTGEGTGKSRGCDTVVMLKRTVPYTPAPLSAALKALFAEPEGVVPSPAYNFIARTKDTLEFNRVTITNGTANIYLTGSLSGLSGVCDDPRAQIQLEETALQFPTVQKVQLYLNNEPTTLTPSQQ